MKWISTLVARHGRNVQYGVIIVLSTLLIVAPAAVDQLVGPIVLNGLYYPFFKLRTAVELLRSQAEANQKLREELMEASLQLSFFDEAMKENERLRSALGFEPPSGYRLLAAEVVAVSGYMVPTTAIIDRGSGEGVFVNQPVVNEWGLIGRVSSTTPAFATVQLLTDPANRVAGRVGRSREMGILRYVVGRGMILDNFPVYGDIVIGDTIVSSGLGGVYPPGLPLGVVSEVKRGESAAFSQILVDPAVNFHRIEELFLLRVEEFR